MSDTTTCIRCGCEILWGPAATALDREVRWCGTCPWPAECQVAHAVGVAAGMRSGSSEGDVPWIGLYGDYEPFSEEGRGYKHGRWAGHWSEQIDHHLDVERVRFLLTLGKRVAR